jgi:hypothetical protein
MITKQECLELLKHTWKIDAIAGMLSENHLLLAENDGIPASNLLECIHDYNLKTMGFLEDLSDRLQDEAPETPTKETSGASEANP